MKLLRIAVTLGLLASPAFAQMVDLPRLTWPTDTAPATQGCDDPTSLVTAVQCDG
jgi:hypothetical protein